MWRALDKAELTAVAARHGLSAPRTAICEGPDDARAAAGDMGYPVLVKPLRSVIEQGPTRHRSGSELAADATQLQALIERFGGEGLVQQRVSGALLSFGGVLADGRLLGEAVSRYRRTWRPGVGNACYSQTIDGPAPLRDRVVSLLAGLGWEGLFELELIEAPAWPIC